MILQCMEPFGECYTTQEFNRFKIITLELVLNLSTALRAGTKSGNKEALADAEFEDCPQYYKMFSSLWQYKDDLDDKGSIAGINMGILIALFIVVAYFGI